MGKIWSLDKPVVRMLGRFGIFVVVLALAAGLYVTKKVAEADRYYRYRHLDQDGDTVLDDQDEDVDGDGLVNISDADANDNGSENWEDAVGAARGLVGKHVDYLGGRFGNLGVKMGWFRSADVVLVAYEKAGVFLAREIAADAAQDPDAYADLRSGAKVDVHNARALARYFKRKRWMLPSWRLASPGDVLLFGDRFVALVTAPWDDTGYDVIWANPSAGKVESSNTRILDGNGHEPTGAAVIGE
ncbi:MAG: hypothetical protein V2A58_01705 [Planctomycetota bacterium]